MKTNDMDYLLSGSIVKPLPIVFMMLAILVLFLWLFSLDINSLAYLWLFSLDIDSLVFHSLDYVKAP